MVKFLEDKGIIVGNWEAENGISNGYLRRSAKDKTNIGINLIDNFLSKFPEVDVTWLITGEAAGMQNDKKHTAATNPIEAAVKSLADTVAKLTEANVIANQTIAKLAGREVVKQG